MCINICFKGSLMEYYSFAARVYPFLLCSSDTIFITENVPVFTTPPALQSTVHRLSPPWPYQPLCVESDQEHGFPSAGTSSQHFLIEKTPSPFPMTSDDKRTVLQGVCLMGKPQFSFMLLFIHSLKTIITKTQTHKVSCNPSWPQTCFVKPRITWNFWSSGLHLPSAGIMGVCHTFFFFFF